jgi:hypothetical protein
MTLNDLVAGFIYQSDGKVDSWRILTVEDLRGDCDDFAVTALYISTGSLIKFWYELIFGSAKVHMVTTASGGGHAVLEYKGVYIDNWTLAWVPREYMEVVLGHQFKSWMFVWPISALKMFYGKVQGVLRSV